jgi:hypothetical protein
MRWLALALLAAGGLAGGLRGAAAKQQMVQWAESQAWRMDRDADPLQLTRELSADHNLEFSRPKGEPAWLELTTRVNLSCGEDTSVYLYQWTGQSWTRRFALEPGSPLDSVQLATSATLVLATGWPPSCGSAWRPFFVGLYRIDSGQRTVLEGTENANSEGETSARLEPDGIEIEFTGQSFDPLLSIRRHVLHYVIGSGGVRRADPIALSAQDFVDEWISGAWNEMAPWSDPGLAAVHDALPKKGQMGTVQRCAGAASLWQVAVGLGGETRYFSVLDQGQHRYRMAAVGETPCKAAKR